MNIKIPIDQIQWDQFKNFGILAVCLVFVVILLLVNIKCRKKRQNPINETEKYTVILIIFIFTIFLTIYASTLVKDVMYAIDIKQDNYTEDIVFITESDYSRTFCFFVDQNGEKYIIRNYDYDTRYYKKISDEIGENFVGKECEIKYYKLSKYVFEIIALE